MAVVRLPDPKLKTLGEKGIECIFVGYAEHFKAFRFSSVPRQSHRSLINGNEGIGGLIVSKEVTEEKEAINDEIDSIMANNTWVLADLPLGCKPLGCKWIFKRKLNVDVTIEKFMARLYHKTADCFGINSQYDYSSDGCEDNILEWHLFNKVVLSNGYLLNQDQVQGDLTKEFLSSRFSIKDMGEADVIIGIRIKHDNTSEKLMPNNDKAISQLEYSRVIGCLMYAMTCTRLDIAFAMGKLSAHFLGNQKQTLLSPVNIESEFVALSAAGKEAEWLRNLILEISLWSKPITPISIWCDSSATVAKTYSQMYNRKSRHLSVRHSMIRELIMNGVVSIEFIRCYDVNKAYGLVARKLEASNYAYEVNTRFQAQVKGPYGHMIFWHMTICLAQKFLQWPYDISAYDHMLLIGDFMHQHAGKYIIFGDMNIVRNEKERSGSLFSRQDADNFNSFIKNVGLIDLPLGGRLFTWMNKAGTKLSKLDRFLISKEVAEALSDVLVTAIDRLWSDHNPILLHVSKFNFGPTPFKLFHSWLLRDSFDEVIKMGLPKLEEYNFRRKLLSHEKFCLLEARIKQWHSETKTSNHVTKHDNLKLIKFIEEKIKAGYANDDDRDSCIKLLQEVDRLYTFESFDLFQSVCVKWDIE
ncbi:zinc finger, CCHC-type containing protein [Tanacetum coccineum]|uniref:Zinc finger, CCHC-type containing protein n=1 Tax=Tanacetum coccineum TaxID=301880 RepID=A0ABQ5A6K6_9ASTR